METVKKYWFWGIFISILSIFAMSHNANAVELTLNLNNYDQVYNADRPSIYCNYNGVSQDNVTWCEPSGNAEEKINYFTRRMNFAFKKGDIVRFYILANTRLNFDNRTIIKVNRFETSPSNMVLLDFKINYMSVDDYELFSTTGSLGTLDSVSITTGNKQYLLYEFVYSVTSDITVSATDVGIGLNTTNVAEPVISYYDQLNTQGNFGIMRFRMLNFQIYRFVGSEENKEVEEKTQDAVDDSQAAGGSSSQDAQTGTTGLLNAITGAVSVISSAQPTNCKINGNMGNLDIGQLDLCANPAPAFVQTIGSLILILMCVPLAISLFNRFIAIFRSFQS